MPELPEVETIARDLRGLVTGARITGVSGDWPKTVRSHEPESFAEAVAGRRIEGVGRRGKQLLIWLGPVGGDAAGAVRRAASGGAAGDAAGSGGSGTARAEAIPEAIPAATDPAVMTVHLKMTGQLFVVPAAAAADGHVHLTLVLDDGREIRFRDIRKFGRIGLYRRDPATGLPVEGEAPGVLAAGAEPLADELTVPLFGELLAKRRGRLKTLLMNQAFLAGVGNIYADEALWRARLHPLRDARSLKPEEARRLHKALREVLAEAVERRGSSVDDYTAPEGDGSMQEHLRVYQRAGEPCERCGRRIKRIVVGGRSTHFCPNCQRLPKGHPAVKAIEKAAERAGERVEKGAGQRAARSRPADEGTTGAAPESTRRRRGPRWTGLSGDGALGRTADEEARARRAEANRKAAAARRAAARSGLSNAGREGR